MIEDNAERARTWQELLEFADFQPLVVPLPDAAPWDEDRAPWFAALVHRGDQSLGRVLDSLHRRDARLPVITLGAHEREPDEDGRVCGQIPLPVRYASLVEALDRARHWRQQDCEGGPRFPIGSSRAIDNLTRLIAQVAGFDSTVLIN